MLDKIYNSNKHNNQLKVDFNSNGIITDIEYEKAYFKFNQLKDKIVK